MKRKTVPSPAESPPPEKAKRRRYGSGNIVQRAEGSWTVRLDLGKGPDGKRRQKVATVRGSQKDAQRELTRMQHELNQGTYIEPSKLTVGEYLDHWLGHIKGKVSLKTHEGYGDFVRVHLKPSLGQHRLDKLQPMHLQDYYAAKLESGRADEKGGLSARTVRHHHTVFREALQQAVKWGMLMRNPADLTEPPRPENREMKFLDANQTAALLAAAEGTRLYMPILLAVTNGLRRGEMLALRWKDVDLKTETLHIRQAMEKTRAGIAFKAPKTAGSRRSIALLPFVVEALRRHRVTQFERRVELQDVWQDYDLVVCREDGSPWSPNAFSVAFLDLLQKKGLPVVRLHDLRHSHATQLIAEEVHIKVISERLGHADPGFTLRVYGHLLPNMQEDAAGRVDRALRKAMGE